MIKFEELKHEIIETKKQIENTDSSKRKYQLHRRLAKLQKEYRYGKMLVNQR